MMPGDWVCTRVHGVDSCIEISSHRESESPGMPVNTGTVIVFELLRNTLAAFFTTIVLTLSGLSPTIVLAPI